MSDLAAFLTARYDEAEKLAREAEAYDGKVNHRYHAGPNGELLGGITLGLFHAQNRPACRLADIKLKRAILAEHSHRPAASWPDRTKPRGFGCSVCDWTPDYGQGNDGWCATVRQLGTEFAGHPGYKQEWRT